MRAVKAGVKYGWSAGALHAKEKDYTVDTAAKSQAKKQTKVEDRPTITLARVLLSVGDTGSFGGWGPKVSGVGTTLKNWN